MTRRGLLVTCLILSGLALIVCLDWPEYADQPRTRPAKEEVIRWSGLTLTSQVLEHRYSNGEQAGLLTLLETLGGGVAVWDYDSDGDQDLFLAGGGRIETTGPEGLPGFLGRFGAGAEIEDVSRLAGVHQAAQYSHGVAVADFDNDGFGDLLVTGYHGLQFFQNMGDGSFRETAHRRGLKTERWSTSAAWADVNLDGALDLYVAHYVDWSLANNPNCPNPLGQNDICSPRVFRGQRDMLLINDSSGKFRDASDEYQLAPAGKGLGVVAGDLNWDGYVDFYVGNDTSENFLYVNDGRGKLVERGLSSGVALDSHARPNGSMGVEIGDFNADGRPDIWVTNYEHELFALYRNLGRGQFAHVSEVTGIARLGRRFVGFGSVFCDLNRDGWEDLVVANGHVMKHPVGSPVNQLPVLLRNNGGSYELALPEVGEYFEQGRRGRGLAAGDLDHDGDQDLVISHVNEPAMLLLNQSTSAGNWISVDLRGRTSSRDAVGTRLVLRAEDRLSYRQVRGGGSYLSHSDQRLLIGLGGCSVVAIEILWPSGRVTELGGLAANQHIVAYEP